MYPLIVSASRAADIPAFMPTGSSIGYRKGIRLGLTRSTTRRGMCRIRIHGLSQIVY